MGRFMSSATAAAFFLTAAGPSAVHADALAYVVHAIPGDDVGLDPELPVDVSLNGDCAIPDFRFGQIVGPVALPAGSYDIEIAPANAGAPCSEAALISAPGVMLEDDVSYSIVAHLTADGAPTASVFVNDTETKRRFATVNVFHTAAAPAVDVSLKRDGPWWLRPIKIRDLANGESASDQIYEGNYAASIVPAGTRDAVFGPVDLELESETVYLVYAVGSLSSKTFTLLVQVAEDIEPAVVYVAHCIPGEDLELDPALPVDVSLNGECALPEFTFGEIAGPVELPAGTYDIAISLADPADPCGNDPVIEAPGVELVGGENYSIAAHLTEDGMPTASVFVNETYTRGPWARVNVFHVAAAPAVDVSIMREHPPWWPARIIYDLANGEQGNVFAFDGNFDVNIFPAGSDQAVFGPVNVPFEGSTVYLVFAVGSLANETFTLLTESFEAENH